MENYLNNLNKIKQPKPEIINNDAKKEIQAKKFTNVGVIKVPIISTTPIADTIRLKSLENPKTRIKFKTKYAGFMSTNNVFSIGTLLCGIFSAVSLVKFFTKKK